MMSGKSGYAIGITIFVRADGQLGLFENGLRQNVLFLYRMFRASKMCRAVYLLNHGDGEPKEDPRLYGIDPLHIVRTHWVKERLDFVVAVGAAMDAPTVKRLKNQGTKFVGYKGGNGGVISMEAMAARPPRPDAERYFEKDDFDTIWMTPQHVHTYAGWCRTVYRCPVHEVPQVWEPIFIEKMPPTIRERFGYRQGKRPWRIGVMDPNITVMKTSHLPAMVCEFAYRKSPESFKSIYITNGLPHKDNPHFNTFLSSMTAAQKGVMTIEPRFVGVQFMANHSDAIVTHHWQNGLNYLYYEALQGNYPLVHNSEFLGGYGYPFKDFDAEDGARALLDAWEQHDDRYWEHKRRNGELIAARDPRNKANIALHEGLLLSM